MANNYNNVQIGRNCGIARPTLSHWSFCQHWGCLVPCTRSASRGKVVGVGVHIYIYIYISGVGTGGQGGSCLPNLSGGGGNDPPIFQCTPNGIVLYIVHTVALL